MSTGTSRSLGERVRQDRARAFVGRAEELARVDGALRGEPGAASVFLVHGPGGIGKTALLRRIADHARQQGRPVVEVDGRALARSTGAFEAVARPAMAQERAVLLIDTFEQCRWLETWLRDRFLPRLSLDAVVVVAGREPPDLEWTLDPGWAQMVSVLALAPLNRKQSAALLAASGLARHQHDPVLRFAGGNPLVLSLAAAVAFAPPPGQASWAPSAQVLETLVARLIGEVPSPVHRQALLVAAQAPTTDEDLLRAVLPEEDVAALFSWLAGLPFVETVDAGVHPHDAAREALTADLRWRTSAGFDDVRGRLTSHLLQRVREVPETEAMSVMADLAYVHRDAPRIAQVYNWELRGHAESGPVGPEDLPLVLEMARATEGDESAALVQHWYARQPQGFQLLRSIDTGEPIAFAVRLVLTAAHAADLDADPVVAAAWRYCQQSEPLADDQHIAIRRFTVQKGVYQDPSAAIDLISWRSLAAVCRSPGLAHAFVVYRDSEFWRTGLGATTDVVEEMPVIGGHPYVLFVNDWRYLTFEQWFAHAVDREGAAAAVPAEPELSRDEFDEAVRQALVLWRRRGALGGSPLGATALVPPASDDADTALRAAVRKALQNMRTDQRAMRGHDAIEATYLGGAATQQAAARRLGVPFSTYRRHLKRGVDDLCDHLWRAARGR